MKNKKFDTDYAWEEVEATTLLLPHELLVYYLYKYNIDSKCKKESTLKEDETAIKTYGEILGVQKEVSQNVFKYGQ